MRSAAVEVGQPGGGQPPGGAAQLGRDADVPLPGQFPLDRPVAGGEQPLGHVERVDLLLVVEAGALDVVQQSRLDRPVPLVGLVEECRQNALPRRDIRLIQFEGGVEAIDQFRDLLPRLRLGRDRQVAGGDAGRAGVEDRGPDRVPGGGGPLGAALQPLVIVVRLVRLVVGLRVRVVRPGQAGALEQGRPVHVLDQNGLDDRLGREAGEADRDEGRVEVPEFEEVRGEFGVGGPVVRPTGE